MQIMKNAIIKIKKGIYFSFYSTFFTNCLQNLVMKIELECNCSEVVSTEINCLFNWECKVLKFVSCLLKGISGCAEAYLAYWS